MKVKYTNLKKAKGPRVYLSDNRKYRVRIEEGLCSGLEGEVVSRSSSNKSIYIINLDGERIPHYYHRRAFRVIEVIQTKKRREWI